MPESGVPENHRRSVVLLRILRMPVIVGFGGG
jgi:hypothetical protein